MRHRRCRTLPAGLLAAAAALLTLSLAPAAARAQTYYSGGGFRRVNVEDDTLLRRGRFEAGLNLAGMFTHSAARAADGTSVTQQTLSMNPGLYGGYMVLDRLELRAVASYLGIITSTGEQTTQNTHSGQLAVQGLYHVPIFGAYALYGGLGVAGFYGITSRQASPTTYAHNATYGGGGQVLAGLLMQPGARLNFRIGIRFDALFGVERAADPSMFMNQTTQNYQAQAEFAISFR